MKFLFYPKLLQLTKVSNHCFFIFLAMNWGAAFDITDDKLKSQRKTSNPPFSFIYLSCQGNIV